MYKQIIKISRVAFTVVIHLKTTNLTKGVIVPGKMIESKVLDYLEPIQYPLLSYFEICKQILELFHPYCFKVALKSEFYNHTYET